MELPYDDPNGWYFSVAEIDSFWVASNNTDISPIITLLPDINSSDESQVERHSWINGDGCVTVEELKIINGGHDWYRPCLVGVIKILMLVKRCGLCIKIRYRRLNWL